MITLRHVRSDCVKILSVHADISQDGIPILKVATYNISTSLTS